MVAQITKESCPQIHRFLGENPITLVDVGCAGGIDPMFKDLTDHSYTQSIGFEANPDEYAKLSTLKGPQSTRATFHNLLLYDKDGTIEFYEGGTSSTVHARQGREELYGTAFEKKSVECAALGTLRSKGVISTPIDVLKLDVEGSELAVLNGADNELLNEVLCIKFEFSFHSELGSNNFAEIHLKLIAMGFHLMDVAMKNYHTGMLAGGDALYLKSPSHLMKDANDGEHRRARLIKLAVISNALRLNYMVAMISKAGANVLSQEEAELHFLSSSYCYLPDILSRTSQKLSLLFFALSQLAAGAGSSKKGIPRLNRLCRLNILYFRTRWKWMRRRHNKAVDRAVEVHLTSVEMDPLV